MDAALLEQRVREHMARGRMVNFVRLQRPGEVLEADIEKDSVGCHVAGLATFVLGIRNTDLPRRQHGSPPLTLSAEDAECLSEILVDEIREHNPAKHPLSSKYVQPALLAAEFLLRCECSLCCLTRWIDSQPMELLRRSIR